MLFNISSITFIIINYIIFAKYFIDTDWNTKAEYLLYFVSHWLGPHTLFLEETPLNQRWVIHSRFFGYWFWPFLYNWLNVYEYAYQKIEMPIR